MRYQLREYPIGCHPNGNEAGEAEGRLAAILIARGVAGRNGVDVEVFDTYAQGSRHVGTASPDPSTHDGARWQSAPA